MTFKHARPLAGCDHNRFAFKDSTTPRLPSTNQEENPINSLKTNNQNNTKQFLEKLGQLGLECGKGESG